MALNVRDILELPSGQKMNLLAGSGGLGRPVTSVEIADYEFAPGVGGSLDAGDSSDAALAPGAEPDLEPAGFIITSFLFAKDDPSLILTAVEALIRMGMAGLAYKKVIYDELPPEVLQLAEDNDFPLLSFDRDVWFENIIFDIMYAVQFDDKVYLSEEKIRAMLEGTMNRSELDIILKGISLKLRPHVAAAYIGAAGPAGADFDAGRALRSFYLSKGLRDKALMVRYGDGLFVITTSPLDDLVSHRLILRQAMEAAGIAGAVCPALSEVHPAAQLAEAFRESWRCHAAMQAEQGIRQKGGRSDSAAPSFDHYSESGIYRVLLAASGLPETPAFAESILGPLRETPDLAGTAFAYVAAGGEIGWAAELLCCHANTVRYRLGRIRELTGLGGCTDAELFLQLRLAAAIDQIEKA